ncbi:MAG: hypothetical protein ACK5JT_05135 [Hyphomicrobiaceae bacterium]
MSIPNLPGDGRRARIGMVIPSVNTVMEPWAMRVVPDGVSVHFARMFIPPETTAETLIEMDRTDGRSANRQLASVMPHAVAYGCTASSIVQGLEYDAHLRSEIAEDCKVPATTAAHAIMTALRTLGAGRISLVSPYPPNIDEAEHRFFETAGFEVVGGACLGIADGFRLAEPDRDEIVELGMRGCADDAQALVVSCLNFRSHAAIATLEEKLGRPVVSSTQATLWHALRLAGIEDPVHGMGVLFERH